MEKRVLLASPRGFCLGVDRGIKILEDALQNAEGTVYVRKEIVHNVPLVNYFKSKGAVFVEELFEVPDASTVVFSTHGVAPSVREAAAAKNLTVIDATCPLVTRIHKEAVRLKNKGYTIILIGIPGHSEIVGTAGEAPDNTVVIRDERDFDKLSEIDSANVAWLSQTTLNVDDTQQIVKRLREKFPLLQSPPQEDCICYATKNRQMAVKNIASECDLFIVAGSAKSSNTQRLAEVASEAGARLTVRVDEPKELDGVDFSDVGTIGLTAGVSVAENQLVNIITHLKTIGYTRIEERTAVEERSSFAGTDTV